MGSILIKVLFEGLAESGSLLPPSQQSVQGSGNLAGGSRSAVPSDGAAHPPPPVHTLFHAPERAVLRSPLPNQFSGMPFPRQSPWSEFS